MAITEPHSAHHGPAPDGGEPPSGGPPLQQRRRHPWRRRSLLAAGALLAAAVTVLGILAGTYQPIEFGGQWSTASGSNYFPGLPSGTGLRSVNTFGAHTGQLYVPPQAGVFTVTESIYNNGPKPVTIEAVSILSPQDQAIAAGGGSPWPLVPAGPVHWTLQIQGLPHAGRGRGTSVAGATLRPGQGLLLGFPLRLSGNGACYTTGGWTGVDTFYVKERFGPFTHWVTVQFREPLTMHEPPSVATRQSHDLTCPPGVTS
jgi:hypothetical protein